MYRGEKASNEKQLGCISVPFEAEAHLNKTGNVQCLPEYTEFPHVFFVNSVF
jgi:hypothetical protein